MCALTMAAAWDITIAETLRLLDTNFDEFARSIADDYYAIWLGSGISLAKVPGLKVVIETVLEHLRTKCDLADPNCRFRKSLDRILPMAGLTAAERNAIDLTQAVADWPEKDRICQVLTTQYGRMLDQHPTGETADYLVWDAINVVATFADPALTPGPEHLGLAALIIEGAVSDCASANWDGLVEKAVDLLAGPGAGVLQARVVPDDVKDGSARARLYKFHGCAILAAGGDATYRERLVGRASQIHGWCDKQENKVFAGKLLDLATSKSTLMLGLSTQDTNIQNIFVNAQQNLPQTFPTHPPAIILSEDQVGADQLSLLQNFYKADYATKADAIETNALLRSYGRSLLPALWLFTVTAKLEAILEKAAPDLAAGDRDSLRRALRTLRDGIAESAPAADHEGFMHQVLAIAGRIVSLFRDGRALGATAGCYTPLTTTGVTRTLADPALDASGLVELALGAALIARGQAEKAWTVTMSDPGQPKTGALHVKGMVRETELFFAGNARAAGRLVTEGHVAEADDVLVVHSHPLPPVAARHPSMTYGRTLRRGRRDVSLSSFAEGETDLDALFKKFKAEIAL